MRHLLLAWLLLTAGAWACGVCVEDKVAATYDYEVLRQAHARGHQVVYVEVVGPMRDEAAVRSALTAQSTVDVGTVRVSTFPQAASFAVAPRDEVRVLAGANRVLARWKLSLKRLRSS